MKYFFFLLFMVTAHAVPDPKPPGPPTPPRTPKPPPRPPCKSIVIKMTHQKKPRPGQDQGQGQKEGERRQGQIIIPCVAIDMVVPRSTIIHFINESPKEVCYWERYCGNFHGVSGFFSFSVQAGLGVYSSVGDYFNTGGYYEQLYRFRSNMGEVYINLKTDFAHIQRSCDSMGEPICISK